MFRPCQGQLWLDVSGHLVVIAVQPAAGRIQHRSVGAAGLQAFDFTLAGGTHLTRVTGHHLVAVGDDRFQGLFVGHGLHVAERHPGWQLLHRGQSNRLQDGDVHPANVELVRLDRQLGRGRVGVVVIVQFLAANDDAPGRHVGAGVGGFEVAVTPPVANAVDDAGGRDRDPHHLQGPDRHPQHAEQRDVDDQHETHTQARATGVEVPLHPVVRRVVAITVQGFLVLGFCAVELAAFEEHLLDTEDHRAVRVAFALAFGMVLAVDRRPLLGHHAGGHPEPEAEEVRGNGVQVQRTVRRVAVQVDRDAGDGDVGEHQSDQQHLPPGRTGQTMGQELDQAIPQTGKKLEIRSNHQGPIQPPTKASGCQTPPFRTGAKQPAILKPGVSINNRRTAPRKGSAQAK
ncbi:hypothetical protein Y695_03018 [Hydrogenophaga sp. T4]|nr:hypothetical protein Y695_03018 [Hydrogenophaga sp. T4]